MSTSKTTVEVIIEDATTGLTVVDSQLRTVANGFGRLTLELEPGIYQARSRVGSDSVSELFVVDPGAPPMTVKLQCVQFASPIPLHQTRTHHEYQEGATRRVAAPTVHSGTGGEFMLIVRDPAMMPNEPPPGDASAYTEGLRAFTLHRIADGETVVDGPTHATVESAAGYAVVRAELNPGAYVLSSHPSRGRPCHQAIFVVPGRRTDVYVSCERTGDPGVPLQPMMGDAAISMPLLTTSFNPDDPTLRRLEVGRKALLRGRRVLELAALEDFVANATTDPMLALYAAYLARFEADEAKAAVTGAAITVLTAAFGELVPDVMILKCDAEGQQQPRVQLDAPPMLWDSWALTANRTRHDNTECVAAASFARSIASEAIPNGNWLTWDTTTWNPTSHALSWSDQIAMLRDIAGKLDLGTGLASGAVDRMAGLLSKAVGPGWLDNYLSTLVSTPTLEHLASLLLKVKWEVIADSIQSVELSNVQRAILPVLISLRQQRIAAPQCAIEQEKIVVSTLQQVMTSPSVLVQNVLRLLETVTRKRIAHAVTTEVGP